MLRVRQRVDSVDMIGVGDFLNRCNLLQELQSVVTGQIVELLDADDPPLRFGLFR